MDEKLFFENGNIKVTNARFIAGNQTYAMSAVNSVKVTSTDITPPNTIPAILMIVGVVWLWAIFGKTENYTTYVWPILALALGTFWFFSIQKTFQYRIILTTSSGEASAFESTRKDDILPIEKALNDAIIYRG